MCVCVCVCVWVCVCVCVCVCIGVGVAVCVVWCSAVNKYSAGHHEQKNKKATGQIKFLVVTIKQQIKLVLKHSQ